MNWNCSTNILGYIDPYWTYFVPWNVHVEPFATSFTDDIVIGIIRFWEKFTVIVAMQWNVKYIFIWFEHALCTVAVMNVPIDNQNTAGKKRIPILELREPVNTCRPWKLTAWVRDFWVRIELPKQHYWIYRIRADDLLRHDGQAVAPHLFLSGIFHWARFRWPPASSRQPIWRIWKLSHASRSN